MSSSFGNNKRKPGATAGAVTEAKRRATLAANWDDYSKQRKVPSESLVPSIMGRNAGIQSIFYAQNNGAVPTIIPPTVYYPGLTFAGFKWTFYGGASSVVSLPTITNTQTWGQRSDSMLSTLVSTNYIGNGVFINTSSDDIALYVKGYYRAPISGSYVFTFQTDDGLQMRLNNQLVINAVNIQNTSVSSSAVTLIAGQYYPLELLWSNHLGGAGFTITSITVNSSPIFTQSSGANTTTPPSLNTYPFVDCFFNSQPVISLPSSTITGALTFNPPSGGTSFMSTPYFTNIGTLGLGYTIEWFQKMSSLPTSTVYPFSIGPASTGPLWLSISSTGLITIAGGNGTYMTYTLPSSSVLLNWCHFAIVFYPGSPTTMRFFLNSINVASTSGTSISGAAGGTNIVLGNEDNVATSSGQFYGFITNFRFVNSSIYPNNNLPIPIPSIPLRPIANTVLLYNVPNDTNKYVFCGPTVTGSASGSSSNPPTFAALSDPL